MEKLLNGVSYSSPQDTSLVRTRDLKRHFSLRNTDMKTDENTGDPSHQTVILIPPSQEYVDPWTSYLSFVISSEAISGQGQVLNGLLSLIDSIQLIDRHGQDIERVEDLSNLCQSLPRCFVGDENLSTPTSLMSIDSAIGTDFWATNVGPGGTQILQTARIPLSSLMGLFRVTPLLPPQLLDGMQMIITWGNYYRAFTQKLDPDVIAVSAGVLPNSGINLGSLKLTSFYTIKQPFLVLDTYVLDPRLNQILDEEYFNNGLPLFFRSWGLDHRQISNESTPDVCNFEAPINRAYREATRVLSHLRVEPTESFVPGIDDNFRMTWNDTTSQTFTPGFKFQLRENGLVKPLSPASELGDLIHYWKLSLGTHRFYTNPLSQALQSGWGNNERNYSVMYPLFRNGMLNPNIAVGLPFESSSNLSGIRVDGTHPLELQFTCPESDLSNFSQTDHHASDVVLVADQFKYVLRTWVEHSKYLFLTPGRNHILS